jgi:hypothetical protein
MLAEQSFAVVLPSHSQYAVLALGLVGGCVLLWLLVGWSQAVELVLVPEAGK